MAKEAVFLVSMATEKFIARIAESAKSQAGREKRSTVQRKDICWSIHKLEGIEITHMGSVTVIRREDEYFFLTGLSYLLNRNFSSNSNHSAHQPQRSWATIISYAPLARRRMEI